MKLAFLIGREWSPNSSFTAASGGRSVTQTKVLEKDLKRGWPVELGGTMTIEAGV